MSKEKSIIDICNKDIQEFENVIKKPKKSKSNTYYCGVDLGTACVVITVLDENKRTVAGAYKYADVVKDGMIVDYIGAVDIVRELKEELDNKLETELIYAAAAIPPGTDGLDAGTIKNVVQGAGFEITAIVNEPTAANEVLKIENGAIVDIGGGTTGISIFKDGKVEKVIDEATGGTHFSLVVAGAYKLSYEEAEIYKRNKNNHDELIVTLKPVVEKISKIIVDSIEGYGVNEIYLVGGSSCLKGIEKIIQKKTGIPTYKPINPIFVTPIGNARNCTEQIIS